MSALLLLLLAVLFVGVWLVLSGARGIPTLTDPKCTRCGYDLRWVKPAENTTCPECGADLRANRAVRFGEFQRKPRSIVAGVALIGFVLISPIVLKLLFAQRMRPAIVAPGVLVMAPSTPSAALPTATLITRLSWSTVGSSDWDELQRRLAAGQLSTVEISSGVEALITYLKTKPAGWNDPLNSCMTFVSRADATGAIPPEQFARLALAYYGPLPTLKARSRCRVDQPWIFMLYYNRPWNLPGQVLVWALRRVSIDGREVQVFWLNDARSAQREDLSAPGSGHLECKLSAVVAPGKHKVTFELDMGVVPSSIPFRTESGNPGQAAQWPKPRCNWSRTIEASLEVVGGAVPILELVTDPMLDPVQTGQLSATATLYPHSDEQSTLKVAFHTKALAVPVGARLAMSAAGRSIPVQNILLTPSNLMTQTIQDRVPRLPQNVQSIDLTLSPAPHYAEERDTAIEQVWGKEIILKNVPLLREDLDSTAASAPKPATRSIGSISH